MERWTDGRDRVVASPPGNQPQVEGKLICTTFRHPTPYTRPRLMLARAVRKKWEISITCKCP
jgi:hypothetical protein